MRDGTRCDCLTATHAVEIDYAKKWAEVIGQALHYGALTGKEAGILLIVLKPEEEKYVRGSNTTDGDQDRWGLPSDFPAKSDLGFGHGVASYAQWFLRRSRPDLPPPSRRHPRAGGDPTVAGATALGGMGSLRGRGCPGEPTVHSGSEFGLRTGRNRAEGGAPTTPSHGAYCWFLRSGAEKGRRPLFSVSLRRRLHCLVWPVSPFVIGTPNLHPPCPPRHPIQPIHPSLDPPTRIEPYLHQPPAKQTPPRCHPERFFVVIEQRQQCRGAA